MGDSGRHGVAREAVRRVGKFEIGYLSETGAARSIMRHHDRWFEQPEQLVAFARRKAGLDRQYHRAEFPGGDGYHVVHGAIGQHDRYPAPTVNSGALQ